MTGAAPTVRALRVAAALAALAAILLAGCGGGGGNATASTATLTAHTFVDLVPQLPNNLDETGTPTGSSAAILPSWASELVRVPGARPGPNARLPADGRVVPYLATTWQQLPNGDYEMGLRRRAHGATGNAFTAADVRWSLERAAARSPVAPYLFSLGHIDAHDPVTILGRHRVRINVTAPSPFTLAVLASPDLAIYDSRLYRAHATSGDPWAQRWGSTHSASFGAYRVEQFLPHEEITLAANPGFWRRVYYTRVLIQQVGDSGDRVDAILGGSATHTSDLGWTDFTNAVNSGSTQGVSASILQNGPAVLAWHLNVSHGPLANVQVRQALSLAIDRTLLASSLDEGNDVPASATIPAVFGGRQPNSYDPVQARSLLRAAGYAHGFAIDVATNDSVVSGDSLDILHTLNEQLYKQLAVTLNYVFVGNTDQLLALEAAHRVESSLEIQTPFLGGAGMLVEQLANTRLNPVSAASSEQYRSTALQGVLEQLLSSPPGAAAAGLAQQAAGILDTDEPTIELVTVPVQNVTRAGVTGYAASTQPVTYYEDLHPAP